MTTTDYETRLERLSIAKEGDTVTVSDGWEPPAIRTPRMRGIAAGDVFTSDGTGIMQWFLERTRDWYSSASLAKAGLDVDQPDTAVDEHINDEWDTTDVDDDEPDSFETAEASRWERMGHTSTDGLAADVNAESDDDEESGPTPIGSVTVRVIPDTDGFVEKIAKVAGEAADAIDAAGFHLDEYQRERVAALEQAVRILESRRAPSTSGAKTFGDMFVRSGVPIVGVQDMVDVAAFIAEGDTGRAEVDA